MMHLTICYSPETGAGATCEAIAAALRTPDVDVRVYDQDVTYRPDSDFWLVLAEDLDRQLAAAKTDSRIDTRRFVVLRAPAGTSTDIAERVRPAAVVYAPDVAGWQRSSRGGLIVRNDVGETLPGELGRASQSENYGSWWPGPDHTLAQQLVAYLAAVGTREERDVTIVMADDAKQRGLPAVTIAADVRAGGMSAQPFAGPDTLVTISGPPGGTATIVVLAARGNGELADVVTATVGAWLDDKLQLGSVETARLAGQDRPCVVAIAGTGFGRAAWLCSALPLPGGDVVIAVGVSARSEKPVTAVDIINHPAVAGTLATLEIR